MTKATKQQQTWRVWESGVEYTTIQAPTAEQALARSVSRVDPDAYQRDKTTWVTVRVRCDATDEESEERMTIEPREPSCDDDGDHDWQSPHEVVGGLKENPGVYGHGGGVRITEVCSRCCAYRITDTWAQDPTTGVQGLRSVEYREADERSEAWARAQDDE